MGKVYIKHSKSKNHKINIRIKEEKWQSKIANIFKSIKGDDKRIYTFLGNLYCDNLSCKEQVGGKAQQYEADSNWVRKCKIGELLSDPKKSESVGKLVGVVADSKECPI